MRHHRRRAHHSLWLAIGTLVVAGAPAGVAQAAAPTVTSVSPSSGPATGGTIVTISGSGFTGATAVKFGGNAASSFDVLSDTQITAAAPAGTGSVDVTVGTSATSPADRYTYTPVVTSVNPSSGPVSGGNMVTITGKGLTGATAVEFGSKPATKFTVSSDTLLTATAPAGTGTVDVTVTFGRVTSATDPGDRYTYTPHLPPVFLTRPRVLGSTRVAFSGTVNPEGLPTTAFFQYGIDLRYRGPLASQLLYNHSTPAQSVGSDSTSHTVSASVSGLVPNALYHARLFAGNGNGSVDGPDVTFKTPKDPTPSRPKLGRTENAEPVSGEVFALTGKTFLPLTESRQIRSGTVFDAVHGTLRLTAAAGRSKTQTGVFGGAVFKITQTGAGTSRGLTTVSIVEGAFKGAPSYAGCKSSARDPRTARGTRRVVQLLRATARGLFRTRGRYSAATATSGGGVWSMADRCDGTITRVTRATVSVTDFVRHTAVTLHAGHSYLVAASKRSTK